MRPQGQNVVQREVVRTVYISVYSIQETSSLIVQHIVDEAKPYHSTHTLFSFIVVPSRRDGLYNKFLNQVDSNFIESNNTFKVYSNEKLILN